LVDTLCFEQGYSGPVARLSLRGGATALLTMLMAAPVPHAHAQDDSAAKNGSSFTVYGGDRFAGSVRDSTTDSTINLQNGSSFALALDIGLDQNNQVEVFYSQQNSALASGAFSSKANNIGLTLYNYQIGGTDFIEEVGRGLYVLGGLGGTTVKPDRSGLNAETFFSGNLGIGWMVPLGAHIGLRFEARGYGILLNNNSAIFCGGSSGCIIAIKGNALYEGEVSAGITARF
jgi:Outer membrane protein beta-barrel domain